MKTIDQLRKIALKPVEMGKYEDWAKRVRKLSKLDRELVLQVLIVRLKELEVMKNQAYITHFGAVSDVDPIKKRKWVRNEY